MRGALLRDETMSNCVIITAAGSGQRMNSSKKKQFIEIAGKPILLHTLDKFIKAGSFERVIITCPVSDIDFLKDILFNKFGYDPHQIKLVKGGKRRQDSVYNALQALDDNIGIVAIHDSVRPFVKISEIVQCVESAKKYGAVTLAHPVKNTIKQVEDSKVIKTLDRAHLWEIYTPQIFAYELIKNAHEKAQLEDITVRDDAELVEKMGYPVHVLKGTSLNIKITDPFDLILAKLLMKEV